MTKEAKKAAKLEKKLKILLGGYMVRLHGTQLVDTCIIERTNLWIQ